MDPKDQESSGAGSSASRISVSRTAVKVSNDDNKSCFFSQKKMSLDYPKMTEDQPFTSFAWSTSFEYDL